MAERIPFAEAISEPLLLQKRFTELSLPQQTALKIFYGCELTADELVIWSAFQGGATYDHLGYIIDVEPIPYTPEEYSEAWLICGRRWGKTDSFSSTIVAYEAACGGHEDYIRKGAQEAVCFLVSQDLKNARASLPLILATLESSPLLKKEISNTTADFISLSNGLAIGVAPPSAKALRGYATPVVAMDEVGLWYTTAESANPDFEIERAVKFAQIQFPHKKRLGTTTPYIKEGLAWKNFSAGTQGVKIRDVAKRRAFRGMLLLHSTTAASGNPHVVREALDQEWVQDPDAFRRESLAEFTDSISWFLNVALLHEAIDEGVYERAPAPGPVYVAAMDPAFRGDGFGFTIVHNTHDGVVVDVARRWKALPGEALNPALILDEIVPMLRAYGIAVVYSDQHHLDSLMQLALDRGFSIEGVPFTAKSKASIFGSLQQLVNTKKLKLLDTRGNSAAGVMLDELKTLEKRNLPGGGMQIGHPVGKHDDMAAVLALAAYKATWMMPVKVKEAPREPTIFEKCVATIRKKKAADRRGAWD
jgi:hypothetical protein